jgi:GTP-binding protein YchF
MERVYDELGRGVNARALEFSEEEEKFVKTLGLLSYKPVIYAANVSEDDLQDEGAGNAYVEAVRKYAAEEGSQVFVISAKVEAELAEFDDEEREAFLKDLGLERSGLSKLINASYTTLGLISYLTAGEKETRAWTITKGTKAPQAAGKIHSDFERGFIRAEIVDWKDLLALGSLNAAREKGLVRLEGKDYVMQDGDVVLFRFNV